MLVLCYSKCSTCKKALAWLSAKQIPFQLRDIKEERPTVKELRAWHALSGLPLRRFFNSSGRIYQEQKLKDKIPHMTEEEQLKLLASNGLLVKRPLVILEDQILLGFKEKEWEEALCK